jgi:hypothetical protein
VLGHPTFLETVVLVAAEAEAVAQESPLLAAAEDVLVDDLAADPHPDVPLQSTADLLRTPAQFELRSMRALGSPWIFRLHSPSRHAEAHSLRRSGRQVESQLLSSHRPAAGSACNQVSASAMKPSTSTCSATHSSAGFFAIACASAATSTIASRGAALAEHTRQHKNWIDQRPAAANERTELGHWEHDCFVGTQGGAVFLTLIDRKSRYIRYGRACGAPHRPEMEPLAAAASPMMFGASTSKRAFAPATRW